jgi:hypothetical protein
VDGFSILDAKGKVAFEWENVIGAISRIDMIVSWAPDSQRVVLLDQFNRGSMLYAAVLMNGVWKSVPTDLNLNPLEARFYTYPKKSFINRVSLLDWVSVTALNVEDKFMVDDLPTTANHWETATETLQFSNGFLKAVN